MGSRGQNWSLDLIIGVVIFLLAIGVIYSLLNSKSREDITPLRIESEVIATKLTTPETSSTSSLLVATDNQLDYEKLVQMATSASTTEGYEKLKENLGVQNDFCIYLKDENGNVVYLQNLSNITGTEKYGGIGSNSIDFNLTTVCCNKVAQGLPCGRAIPAGCVPPPSDGDCTKT